MTPLEKLRAQLERWGTPTGKILMSRECAEYFGFDVPVCIQDGEVTALVVEDEDCD